MLPFVPIVEEWDILPIDEPAELLLECELPMLEELEEPGAVVALFPVSLAEVPPID
jgi:hypothetical protein